MDTAAAYYTKNHEWIIVEGNEVIVGITDYAQEEMGDVVFVELPEAGEEFNQGDQFAVIESVKAVSDVFLPVSGEIIEVNEKLLEQPELINEEPHNQGWLVKVQLSDENELDDLMDRAQYQEYIEEVS